MEIVLERFWGALGDGAVNKQQMVHKDEVVAVNMRFIKALYPAEDWDEKEAKAIAVEDWDRWALVE